MHVPGTDLYPTMSLVQTAFCFPSGDLSLPSAVCLIFQPRPPQAGQILELYPPEEEEKGTFPCAFKSPVKPRPML